MITLYQVRLLREFRTEKKPIEVYPKGSWQYAWQDRHGFWWLRGKRTKDGRPSGWEFSNCARPGVDFDFPYWDYPSCPKRPHDLKDAFTWRPGNPVYEHYNRRKPGPV